LESCTQVGIIYIIMKKIKLTQGKYAIIDDEDYSELSKYKWYAWKHRYTYYAVCNRKKIDGKYTMILMHRYILRAPKNKEVDHINHNGLDNRRTNIRIVTSAQNKWNTRFVENYKGATYYKRDKKWIARIRHNGKKLYLGSYQTMIEANLAYKVAVILLRT